MDAKNLAVLMQLKAAMEKSGPAIPKPSSNGFSEESLKALNDVARRRFETPPPQSKPKPDKLSSKFMRAECRSCKETYSVEVENYRPYWICSSCKRAKKHKQQEELDARRAAQYANASGTKVQQVERAIQAIKIKIDADNGSNRRGLLLRLDQLEKELALEKVHAISKLNTIKARKVPGSYGSSR